jgi:hypothetical protein
MQQFWCLWFYLMDESGREIVDGVVSEPDLSLDEYVLNCLLVYCHLSQSIELLACLYYCRLIELLACLLPLDRIDCLISLVSLDRIACFLALLALDRNICLPYWHSGT